MMRLGWPSLVLGALLTPVLAQAQTPLESDEQILKNTKLPTDTDGLIKFFRQRSNRAIEATMVESVSAAARVLAARNVPQAAELLFDFLPSVRTDPALEDQIIATLGRLAVNPGKVDPLIVKALKDSSAYRRGVAAYLLGRRGDLEHRGTLRQVLGDADPLVRQRVGQGLLGKHLGELLAEAAVADDNLLREQKMELAEKPLLDFFRQRTLNPDSINRIRGLIRTLGADSHKLREQAHQQLLKDGAPALPFLKTVEFDADVERSRRARDLMTVIRAKTNTAVPIAAAHWLARAASKGSPAEAIRVLLGYVPCADDETVEDEVLTGLVFLSLREPGIDAEVRQALSDPAPARRGAAAYVLGHVGVKEDVTRAKALLDDSEPVVRLRAAQGMLAARDPAALPCLAELLEHIPGPYLPRVEEALYRVAADKGPVGLVLGASPDARRKAAGAWAAWAQTNRAQIDLVSVGERDSFLGLYTICEYDNRFGNIGGQISEYTRSGQKRWSFAGVTGAMDAHALANGRVLVAENNTMTVTERDSRGTIKWEYRVPNNPICVQRLTDGNTFIASYNMVMEVRPDKQEVYRYTPGPQFYIFSAHKARNGHIVAITAQGQILEMDAKTGNTIHSVQTNTLGNWCSVELMPNGNYLVASMSTNTVREIDRKGGQEVWSKPFPGAFRATRLPTGNILVASMTTREVAEMDRNGTIRWRTTCAGRPWSVHYR